MDSTRLVTPKSKSTKDKGNCLTEPRNNRKPSTKSRNEEEPEFKAPQTEVRRQRLRTPAVAKISANQIRSQNERWRQLIDNSDSEAEGNNASDDDDADRSDESWKAPEEEDSDFEPSPEKPKEKNKKNITNKREVTIKKPVVTNKKSNTYEISSESDIEEGRKSDVSWQKGDDKVSVSDDSDFETPHPKVTKKQKANPLPNNNKTKANSKRGRKKKRDMSQDDLVYLDLSKEEVSIQEDMPESPPANHDVTFASRLNDILKTCRHEDKPKLPSSAQSTKTKRKLFTPMFGHDLEGDDPALPEIVEKENKKILVNENESIILDNITCPFDAQGRPKKLDVVNKQLESVKAGKPIFKLTPSPKKKADTTPLKTRTEKNNETPTSKTKAETKTKSQTPTTRKGEPTNLADLCRTPDYKYSFLKSLDGNILFILWLLLSI